MSIKEAFGANISYRVGNGENIYFWLDRWIGDKPLAERFPNLFSCASNFQAKVSSYLNEVGDTR